MVSAAYQYAVVIDGAVQIILSRVDDALDSAEFHARGLHPRTLQPVPHPYGGLVDRPVVVRVERWRVESQGRYVFDGVECEWIGGVSLVDAPLLAEVR